MCVCTYNSYKVVIFIARSFKISSLAAVSSSTSPSAHNKVDHVLGPALSPCSVVIQSSKICLQHFYGSSLCFTSMLLTVGTL